MMLLFPRGAGVFDIYLNDEATGLSVLQHASGTVVYWSETETTPYRTAGMPRSRYSFHGDIDTEAFERDIRALLTAQGTRLAEGTNVPELTAEDLQRLIRFAEYGADEKATWLDCSEPGHIKNECNERAEIQAVRALIFRLTRP